MRVGSDTPITRDEMARAFCGAGYALVFQETEPTYEEVPFLHVGKTGRIGVDARIGGQADVPEAQDEELQKLKAFA